MIAGGLFIHDDPITNANNGSVGLFRGGGLRLLGLQLLAIICVMLWVSFITISVNLVSCWLQLLYCRAKRWRSIGDLCYVVALRVTALRLTSQLHMGFEHVWVYPKLALVFGWLRFI